MVGRRPSVFGNRYPTFAHRSFVLCVRRSVFGRMSSGTAGVRPPSFNLRPSSPVGGLVYLVLQRDAVTFRKALQETLPGTVCGLGLLGVCRGLCKLALSEVTTPGSDLGRAHSPWPCASRVH